MPPEKIKNCLMRLCYRSIQGNIWIKPYATTLLVISFPDSETLKLTQIFGNITNLKVWDSKTIRVSELYDLQQLQILEIEVCREAQLGINCDYSSLVPELDWKEEILNML